MRIVRYDAQERVDLPDITQMSFLVLGEFRRTVRGLLLGPGTSTDYENFIIRGFAVEAQPVPDATIRVRLDPGGSSPLGFAIGAENLSTRIDYGQLVGGDDLAGALEGNATYTLDFSAQPPGTYTVQMRFVYADGTNDNRAFWDAGANSEFVAATDTRYVPGIELRISGAPSDEWIDLADVAWGGATVVSGDITDLRTFALEGTTPFQQTTQGGTGGIADFSRSSDRAANGVNEVYPFLRALARQIQDLKGPDDSGNWSWWARPFKPFDPSGLLTATQTKTLRSIDTVSYTVGDGVQTFGDFNGANGLDDCLDHIAGTNNTVKASRIEIVLMGAPSAYVIGSQKAITAASGHSVTVAIRAGVSHVRSGGGVNVYGRPVVTISGAGLGVGEVGILAGNSVSLELDDIEVGWTGTTSQRGMFACGGGFRARGCRFVHTVTPATDAGYIALSASAQHCLLEHCDAWGRFCFYDTGTAGTPPARYMGGRIEGCRLQQAQILLYNPSAVINTDVTSGFVIRDSYITGRSSATYSGSVAMIDVRSSDELLIEDCKIEYGTNENAIDARRFVSANPSGIKVRDCEIYSSVSNGSHAVDGGANGADGTGWGLNIEASSGTTFLHSVERCTFSNNDSCDSGCVRMRNARYTTLRGCRFIGLQDTGGGSDRCRAMFFEADSTTHRAHLRISDCTVSDCRSAHTAGLRLVNQNDASIENCSFWGDSDGVDVTGRTTAQDVAIYGVNVDWLRVKGCTFQRWEPAGTTSHALVIGGGGSGDQLTIEGNTFSDCGNYAIDIISAGLDLSSIINGNSIDGRGSDNQLGIRASGQGRWAVNNNTVYLNTGAGQDGIFLGTNVRGACMGNTTNADIRKTSVNAVRGYNETGQDLNECNAYT